jgi:NADH:ubiquinone oxidoreductase subunit E
LLHVYAVVNLPRQKIELKRSRIFFRSHLCPRYKLQKQFQKMYPYLIQKLELSSIPSLNEIQSSIGFVSEPMQEYVAEQIQVPISRVHGVVSFYSFFTTTPRGKHTIKFCMGTACYVGGTSALIEKTKQVLGIEPGKTTPDGNITVEVCRCVGACSQAPVIVIDEEVIGRVKPNKLPQLLKPIQDNTE